MTAYDPARLAHICKPLYDDKIADMLESGEWEAPTAFDNLPRGIRVLVELLTVPSDLDAHQRELAVRWVREATALLEEIQARR